MDYNHIIHHQTELEERGPFGEAAKDRKAFWGADYIFCLVIEELSTTIKYFFGNFTQSQRDLVNGDNLDLKKPLIAIKLGKAKKPTVPHRQLLGHNLRE